MQMLCILCIGVRLRSASGTTESFQDDILLPYMDIDRSVHIDFAVFHLAEKQSLGFDCYAYDADS